MKSKAYKTAIWNTVSFAATILLLGINDNLIHTALSGSVKTIALALAVLSSICFYFTSISAKNIIIDGLRKFIEFDGRKFMAINCMIFWVLLGIYGLSENNYPHYIAGIWSIANLAWGLYVKYHAYRLENGIVETKIMLRTHFWLAALIFGNCCLTSNPHIAPSFMDYWHGISWPAITIAIIAYFLYPAVLLVFEKRWTEMSAIWMLCISFLLIISADVPVSFEDLLIIQAVNLVGFVLGSLIDLVLFIVFILKPESRRKFVLD